MDYLNFGEIREDKEGCSYCLDAFNCSAGLGK